MPKIILSAPINVTLIYSNVSRWNSWDFMTTGTVSKYVNSSFYYFHIDI